MVVAMDTFLTIGEIAEKLRVSRNTVVMLIDRKELAATRVGRQYRITESDYLDYVNRNNTKHIGDKQEEEK